ncbi:Hypothetical protein, putative [Bodo saltans]|uniref:WD40 repeat-containing protein n=1 Tax=Bodo saltans TaxID=75058 RepID=A0A0S4JK86_BODSA|nr:Hypothetical protein, putative [Bodo saltans]|eukprot:CUG90529.1 Hypothetical protein, putative [Bodo saltans]
MVSVDRSGGITLWNMAVRRAVLTVSYEVLLAEFVVRHQPPPSLLTKSNKEVSKDHTREGDDVTDDASNNTASSSTSAPTTRELGATLALQRLRTQNVPGLLCVLDVTSHVVFPSEVHPELDGLSELPHHPVGVIVQGRNQLAALVMMYPPLDDDDTASSVGGATPVAASSSPTSSMRVVIECVFDVPQFGFCKCCIVPSLPQPESHNNNATTTATTPSASLSSSSRHVLVAAPGEAGGSNGGGGGHVGGASAFLYQIARHCRRRQHTDEATTTTTGSNSTRVMTTTVSCSRVPRRVQIVEKSVRCGQIMAMSFQSFFTAAGDDETQIIMSVVATESGHGVIAVHRCAYEVEDRINSCSQQHVQHHHQDDHDDDGSSLIYCKMPSMSMVRCFVLRSCAESLMHARIVFFPTTATATAATTTTLEGGDAAASSVASSTTPLLFCVSAEGHMQGYRCDEFHPDNVVRCTGAADAHDGTAVVPRWPLVWEHTVTKGVGSLEVVVVDKHQGEQREEATVTTLQPEGTPAQVVVMTGGWDGTTALLDGRTGGIITALHYHGASMSSITIASDAMNDSVIGSAMAGGQLQLPRFARAARSSRLGGGGGRGANAAGRETRRSGRGAGGAAAVPCGNDLVFVTSSEDGGIAAWRLCI